MASYSVALLFASACGSDTQVLLPDAGASDAGPVARRIEVLTMGSILLGYGEERRVDVRVVRPDGTGVSGALVRFALDGTANDASLDEVSVVADTMGNAGTRVLAGGTPGSFRVRATTEGAAAVFIDIAISEAGFGTVRVLYSDQSDRSPVSFVAEVYTDTGCAQAVAGAPVDRVEAFPPGQSTLTLAPLAAGESYSVLVRGFDTLGEEVALGCNDGVLVPVDAEAVVTVTLAARERVLEGSYDTKLSFGLASLHTLADGAMASAVGTFLGGGTEAEFFLDALDAELRGLGSNAEADALEQARTTTSLEADFDAQLQVSGIGLNAAALSIAASLRGTFAQAELIGAIVFEGEPLAGTLTLTRTGAGQSPGPLPTVPWLSLIAPVSPTPTAPTMYGQSVGVEFQIGLGAGGALDALLDLLEAPDVSAVWGDAAGVGEIASFPLPAGVDAVCNVVCRAGVFRSVAANLSEPVHDALIALDVDHAELSLAGAAQTVDDDSDFVSEAFVAADLTATWGTGVEFSGQLLATRPE